MELVESEIHEKNELMSRGHHNGRIGKTALNLRANGFVDAWQPKRDNRTPLTI